MSRFATVTSCYPGRSTCHACGRVCGISQPAHTITAPNVPTSDGTYCRTCAGKRLLDLASACEGLDEEVSLISTDDLRRSEDTADKGEAAGWVLARMAREGIDIGDDGRAVLTRLGIR